MTRDTMWQFLSNPMESRDAPPLRRHSTALEIRSLMTPGKTLSFPLVVRYGGNIFYAQLDIGTFFNDGHELFLTDNGVVLCYNDVAPMYLTFHYRPPHEQDPGPLKYEAGVSSSFEEATPSATADSWGATGASPSGEVPTGTREVRQKAMPRKKANGC